MTQYESIIDPTESWMEKWLLHEANEVYNYYSCAEQEDHPHVKAIWERFLDYELGHLQFAIKSVSRWSGVIRPNSCRRGCRNPSPIKATVSMSARCYGKKWTSERTAPDS